MSPVPSGGVFQTQRGIFAGSLHPQRDPALKYDALCQGLDDLSVPS